MGAGRCGGVRLPSGGLYHRGRVLLQAEEQVRGQAARVGHARAAALRPSRAHSRVAKPNEGVVGGAGAMVVRTKGTSTIRTLQYH